MGEKNSSAVVVKVLTFETCDWKAVALSVPGGAIVWARLLVISGQ
jgi:hypothetical protein